MAAAKTPKRPRERRSVLVLSGPNLVVEEIRQVLRTLSDAGLTVLLVEQKIDMAIELSRRAYVLIKGRIALAGTAEEIRQRPAGIVGDFGLMAGHAKGAGQGCQRIGVVVDDQQPAHSGLPGNV